MLFNTIDQIVKRGLLEDGLPIHYYFDLLLHSSTALRELSFDTLKIVNTLQLPVSPTGAVNLPDDFVDDVALCVNGGQVLSPLPKQKFINPMRYSDDTGTYEPPQNAPVNGSSTDNVFWGQAGWFWFWNVNDFGEPTGRFFGAKGGTQMGYKVVPERRQIQMTGYFDRGGVILQYISNGQSIDAASQIDTRAIETIRAFQEWKISPNKNNEQSPEGRAFYSQKSKLRSRLNTLSITDIKNVIRNSFTAAMKN